MPDTTAESVRSYLQEADYDDVWALWPETGELYEGGRPHGLYKVEGRDPEHADWFWARYRPDRSVDAEGRVSSCQECHVDGADYVLTDDFGMVGGGG